MTGHLSRLREKAHAAEAVLFERQTFLVVARSAPLPPRVLVDGRLRRPKTKSVVDSFSGHEDQDDIIAAGAVGAYSESPADVGAPNRYEVVSDIFKMFRIAINTCALGWFACPYVGQILISVSITSMQHNRRRRDGYLAVRLPNVFSRD